MLSEQEAQDLMLSFISLREKAVKTKKLKDLQKLKNHETKCIQKFMYLVTMRTNRYKGFSNHDDLIQEGLEALVKAMKNYNPAKGIWFYWAHRYIDTKISRAANLHTAIRYPLKYAKEHTPHKETTFPLMIETRFNPDKQLEGSQINLVLNQGLNALNDNQKEIIKLCFGLDGNRPMSINKICKKMSISRAMCAKTIQNALGALKENIKL